MVASLAVTKIVIPVVQVVVGIKAVKVISVPQAFIVIKTIEMDINLKVDTVAVDIMAIQVVMVEARDPSKIASNTLTPSTCQSFRYTKSGVGSFVRSNQFKNAIVGAAAGYLTYQAGKAIIRNVMSPMM